MAVLENYRKKDFGKDLIIHNEQQCKNQGMDLIWFMPEWKPSDFMKKWDIKRKGLLSKFPMLGNIS